MSSAAPSQGRPVWPEMLYGTQYYRAPTPLAAEWAKDLAALGDYGLDTIQLRLNWRNNERAEDVYTFEDVDRLMDLAEQNGKKVIIKFLLECAPQYVFDRYGGTRIGPKGEEIRGISHGAFYSGGWLPCFTNPKVAARAAKFVRKVAERYAGRKSVLLWNAWNEPRNRPVEECFCSECRKAFGAYLKEKFGTIERLNDFYGVCEESFDRIALPASTAGFWDIYEFKLFKSGKCIRENLRFVYDAVREFDKERPIISHVGSTSGFQTYLGDICDDFEASRAVDGWGTSLPDQTRMDTRVNRLEYNRLHDWMRSIDRNFFIYEIYPGLGMFKYDYDTTWDMDYKLYNALACGAKGMFFWQYRAERVGNEQDCAGLARANGTPRPVLQSVKRFADVIGNFRKKILGFYPASAEVAIYFDYKSLLMGEIEEAREISSSAFDGQQLLYYPYSHWGLYRLLRSRDIPVDYLSVHNLADFSKYKVICFPNCTMIDPAVVPALERFVAEGGVVIADDGFGLRQENTWMNPYPIACGRIMKAQLDERRLGDRELVCDGVKLPCSGYHSEFCVENARTVLSFADGASAVREVRFGNGRTYLLGFSLGYSVVKGEQYPWSAVLDKMIGEIDLAKTRYGRLAEDFEEYRLYGNDEQYVFLINSSKTVRCLTIEESVLETYAAGTLEGRTAVVPPKSCMILLCRRDMIKRKE